MSLPGTPRRPQVIDTFDDEDEEDDIYLPEAEKSKPDAQKAAEDDAEEAALLEDEATNKQAAFSAQINEDMRLMHENFDAQQSERFGIFRSTAFKSAALKRVLVNIGLNNPNPSTLPLVGGVAKVFVAEMVEKARDIQKQRGDTGALSPEHLREAYRVYKEENGKIGPSEPMKGKLRFTR